MLSLNYTVNYRGSVDVLVSFSRAVFYFGQFTVPTYATQLFSLSLTGEKMAAERELIHVEHIATLTDENSCEVKGNHSFLFYSVSLRLSVSTLYNTYIHTHIHRYLHTYIYLLFII